MWKQRITKSGGNINGCCWCTSVVLYKTRQLNNCNYNKQVVKKLLQLSVYNILQSPSFTNHTTLKTGNNGKKGVFINSEQKKSPAISTIQYTLSVRSWCKIHDFVLVNFPLCQLTYIHKFIFYTSLKHTWNVSQNWPQN